MALHTNLGTTQWGFRVPIKFLRETGFSPERGMHAAAFKGRLILWNDDREGVYRQNDEGQLLLSPRGLSPRLNQNTYTIVQGPNYLIVTTGSDAAKLAPGVPVIEHSPWERLLRKTVEEPEGILEDTELEVLAWNDVKITQTNPRRPSPMANVSGRLWWIAGFHAGDPVRFKRYLNATVVEKCAPEDKHSVLCQQTVRGMPRHYVGPTLFDVHATDKVRVIATPDRLIITTPSSNIGSTCDGVLPRLCVKQTCQHAPDLKRFFSPAVPVQQPTPPGALDPADVRVLRWKEFNGPRKHLCVSGTLWKQAGFKTGDPVRVVEYTNGLAVEPCAEADMDWCVGSSSSPVPTHSFGLVGNGLGQAKAIRVIAAPGRLILTAADSDLSAKCRQTNLLPPGKALTAAELRRRAESLARKPVRKPVPAAKQMLVALDPSKIKVSAWRDYQVDAGQTSVSVNGGIWAVAGIQKGTPVRICQYANGVAIEKVPAASADRTLGSPSSPIPYHLFALGKFGLLGRNRVRVLAMPGRVVLTTPGSDLGELCNKLAPIPPSYAGRRRRVPVVIADKEVVRYPVPEGRRLQVQGKWLQEFGFTPGVKFSVSESDGEIQVTRAADGAMTVTEHSPGRSKLYVPALGLKTLNCTEVALRARDGVLRVVPALAQ
ncbi:hypothetical protein G3A43_08695 [Paraburkholderia aspalathi]|nr:hypothetical protein [Paraburkholderia aspalathi]MBK3780335.1 hypothetical protein [Paraburkholderia aspalathi]